MMAFIPSGIEPTNVPNCPLKCSNKPENSVATTAKPSPVNSALRQFNRKLFKKIAAILIPPFVITHENFLQLQLGFRQAERLVFSDKFHKFRHLAAHRESVAIW